MQDHAASIASTASLTSYGISASLILGDWVAVIDQHTWIIGAAGFAITWTTNLVFKIYDRRTSKST
jgi:hypothetical protein